ncbi:Cadherin-18 [Labeo rohita]|uniref:Cadherin-18 n=1 Tax=Labeo rohita TaxID=84645 RepID=A0ABQ8LFP2_LABRO|nr:Cadherin-18 [Labeo rohita]
MDNCSALHVLLMISIMPGWLVGDFIISKKQHEIRSSKISRGSHLRVRRGWIWSQIFVEEEDPTPRKIGQLKSDYDTGDFTIKYILSGEGAGEIFKIDEYTGDIYLSQRLDRELKPFYILQAQAINRSSKQPVEPESEFIIKVTATDADDPMFGNNAKLIYSILEGEPYFSVEPKTGANPMLDNNLYALNSRT